MIRYEQGNLLETRAEALVNTVNEIGVMGKGIALQVAEAFPDSAKAYQAAAKRGEVHVGTVLVTKSDALVGPRWILHFPTKRHWRNPSRLEWVRQGLADLVRALREHGIRSVALPPLGCGAGGLQWGEVRAEIERSLSDLPDVEVHVYEPTARYHTPPKKSGATRLTPARALIAELIRRYSILGFDCSLLEIQKLAWFLKRSIEAAGARDPMRLTFSANRYGPYADALRHLLGNLQGTYLQSEKRVADLGPFEPVWLDAGKREEVGAYLTTGPVRAYLQALDRTTELIDGFESPLGMELLATVDWLVHVEKCDRNVAAVRRGIRAWPAGESAAERKLGLLDERLVGLALERLARHPELG